MLYHILSFCRSLTGWAFPSTGWARRFDEYVEIWPIEFFLQPIEQSGVIGLLEFNWFNFFFNRFNLKKKSFSKVRSIQLFIQPVEHGRKLNVAEGSTNWAFKIGWTWAMKIYFMHVTKLPKKLPESRILR